MQGGSDILIASANAVQSIAIELVLTHEGQQVTRVTSGPQALSHIKSLQPKLVLLDPDLPDMSGLEVCQRLRMDPITAELPIVVITPNTHAVFRRKLSALGVTAVLAPPLTAQDILGLPEISNMERADEN